MKSPAPLITLALSLAISAASASSSLFGPTADWARHDTTVDARIADFMKRENVTSRSGFDSMCSIVTEDSHLPSSYVPLTERLEGAVDYLANLVDLYYDWSNGEADVERVAEQTSELVAKTGEVARLFNGPAVNGATIFTGAFNSQGATTFVVTSVIGWIFGTIGWMFLSAFVSPFVIEPEDETAADTGSTGPYYYGPHDSNANYYAQSYASQSYTV